MARYQNSYTFQQSGGFPRGPRPYQRTKEIRKHSGAKWKEGETSGRKWAVIHGWNYSKERGMVTFIASPYKGTHVTKSRNGKEWANWFVKITIHRTMQTVNQSGLYDLATRRLILPELGMIANPGAPNGGYFGSFKRK